MRLLGLDVECCDKLSRKFLCDVGDAFPGVFFDVGCNQIACRSDGCLCMKE